MGFIHLLNWDGSNFQHFSNVEVIRNVHLDHESSMAFLHLGIFHVFR